MHIENISISNFSGSVAIALIRLYQRCISPALGPRCRFYPTCSEYTLECIAAHGFAKGTWLGVMRLCKCQPWHPGGIDLPPGATPNHPTNHNP